MVHSMVRQKNCNDFILLMSNGKELANYPVGFYTGLVKGNSMVSSRIYIIITGYYEI